mgnify:FL=1
MRLGTKRFGTTCPTSPRIETWPPPRRTRPSTPFCFSSLGVLGAGWDAGSDFERAQGPERPPVVRTPEEVKALLEETDGLDGLVAHLLYGARLWPSEARRLRVKDLDFEYEQITVRQGSGKNDRCTMRPASLEAPSGGRFARARPSGGKT